MHRTIGVLTGLAMLAAAATAAGQTAAPGSPGTGKISIELNKLEEREGSCRVYLVIENGTTADIKNIELDVFIFDRDEIITRRVGLNTRRLKPGRTYIRLFDITEVTCAAINRLVLNEVISCTAQSGEAIDCEDRLALSSRARAGFID